MAVEPTVDDEAGGEDRAPRVDAPEADPAAVAAPDSTKDPAIADLRDRPPRASPSPRLQHDCRAFAIAPVTVCAIDAAGTVVFWNDAAERLLGWSAEEVLGTPAPFLSEGTDASAILSSALHTASTRQALRGVRKDAAPIDLEIDASVIDGGDDGGRAILLVLRDVTAESETLASLTSGEHKYHQLVVHSAGTITVTDADGHVIESTGEARPTLGYSPGFWKGKSGFDLLHPDELERAADAWAELVTYPGHRVREVFRARHADGHYEHIEFTGVNLLDDPVVAGVVVSHRDSSNEKQSEKLLADEARVLELIARDASLDQVLPEIVALVEYHSAGSTGIFLVEEASGYVGLGAPGSLPESMVERVLRTPVASPDGSRRGLVLEDIQIVEDFAADPRTAGFAEPVLRLGFRSGWAIPIRDHRSGRPLGFIGTWFTETRPPSAHERDVAEVASNLAAIAIDRDSWQRELFERARFDPSTSLPNRTLILETLDAAVTRARGRQEPITVMLIDLDRFKLINDSLGHATGDDLIGQFAKRLRDVLRMDDFVGRVDADEFVVILEPGAGRAEAELVSTRIGFMLDEPFFVEDSEIFLTASVGVAVAEMGKETAQTLLQQADAAMLRAKSLGRDRVVFFDEHLRTKSVERLRIDRDLRMALERSELELYYQPEIDVTSREVVGAEALLRWNHPELGLVAPDGFIRIAEETGLIVPIGYWVLEEAVRQARAWDDVISGIDDFAVSLNLSARQLRNRSLVDTVAFVLTRYNWPPSRLTLELTESILIEDRDATLFVLNRLRTLGVKLAIDDFGTGFASLDYLHRLTVDVVKIDRSFVTPLRPDGSGSPVAAALIHMAKSFGLTTTAEGVETAEQFSGLGALGCDLAQGFLFAQPLPAPRMSEVLQARRRW